MDFIEINDSVDYENVGCVNENGMFENASTDDVNNMVIGNPPQNLVDNQSFYRDFAKKNPQQYQKPQRQQFPYPKPILKQSIASPQQPQKKVTYDDILSSLNMKVVNGKLQIIRGDDAQPLPPQMQRGRGQVPPSHMHQHTQAQAYTKQNEFYNKFLQAQQHQQQMVEEEEIELTPEQMAAQQQYHKRLMMIQYIKNQQQRQRVGQIKSKKMKFV